MEVTKTDYGAEIALNANDVDSAVRQFICTCHSEFARDHVINSRFTYPVVAEAVFSGKQQPENSGIHAMEFLDSECTRFQKLAAHRLETIKAMSGYLDDVAEALGVPKPTTPIAGVGACWKVMGAIQQRNKALESLLNVADYEERKRIIDAALAESV